MTVGENIRRIRKYRGLTIQQLGDKIGVSEAYVRAYETGRRNPKPDSLEAIANVLAVNPEVLKNSDFDGMAAIHRLFQIFRQYPGEMYEVKDRDGNETVAVSFGSLLFMSSWYERYKEYAKEVAKCDEIKDPKKHLMAIIEAEDRFFQWMDTYPQGEQFPEKIALQKQHDEKMDWYAKNSKATE